ncbi:MAG: aspartyl protease family protein [Candidatus Obscuribacterales bacterium]|nr:aspartyl protease family protein [Candidatus Obscuribacterales bacterium]
MSSRKKNFALFEPKSSSLFLAMLSLLALTETNLFEAPSKQAQAAETTEPSEASLESIINKVFLAYGGKEALAKLSNNSLATGEQKTLNETGSPAKTTRYRCIRKSGGLRLDVESEGGWISTVYDGIQAWKMEGKAVRDLSQEETALLSRETEREPAVLTHFGEAAYSFKLRGSTVYKAIPVFAIEVAKGKNPASTVFVDKKNYLVIALSYPAVDLESKSSATISIDYEEYRPSGGTLVAFKQVQSVNDAATLETDIQQIEFGGINDDDAFRRPDRPNEVRLEKPLLVPMQLSHKVLLIKARVNDGEPMDFLFDTGASQTLIDRRLAAENLLDRQAGMKMTAAVGQFFGQSTEIPKIQIGELAVPNVQAVIVDLSNHARQLGKPIAGVLGNNVLNRFAVTIDYGKSQIGLRDYATYKAPAGANIISYSDKKGPVVKILLNGKEEVSCLVDTGAAFNNLPSAIGKKYQAGQSVHYTEGVGADGRSVKLGTIQIANVKIGNATVRDSSFTYSADAALDKKGVVTGSSIGILGNPFWQNFNLTIDYRMRQIILQPNPLLASRQQLEQLVSTGDSKLNIYRDFRAAEQAYQAALNKVQFLGDPKQQARLWGRLGNLRRIMAKDLGRPEQARIAYEYFSKAQELAHKMDDRETEGRILADWALLYMDNNQLQEAQRSLEGAVSFAPQDPQVMVDYAVYLNKNKRYGDMRYYIDKALFLEASNWQALWYRLKLCETFNDLPQEKETLKEILKYYPWSKIAQDKYSALNNPNPGAVPGNNPGPVPQ